MDSDQFLIQTTMATISLPTVALYAAPAEQKPISVTLTTPTSMTSPDA
jgi:hypothetical protein